MMIPAETRLRVKIYYEDTDALGIVYYANYLKFFERGRTEMFEVAGLSLHEWNRDGFNFAVFKANLTFLAPARLGEICEVVTKRLKSKSPFRVPFKQELWRQDELITEVDLQLVCLDQAFELREFPEELLVGGIALD